METEIIQGHRKSNEGGARDKRSSEGIDISLSAPKYSILDEEKGIFIYPKDAPKIRVFESEVGAKRIQMYSVLPEKMPHGGYTPGKERYIQFRSGKFRTNDPKEIVTIENSTGYGISIWDVDALVRVAKKARINAAVKAAEDDPEILEALKVKFDMKDFVDKEPEADAKTKYEGGEYTPKGDSKKE